MSTKRPSTSKTRTTGGGAVGGQGSMLGQASVATTAGSTPKTSASSRSGGLTSNSGYMMGQHLLPTDDAMKRLNAETRNYENAKRGRTQEKIERRVEEFLDSLDKVTRSQLSKTQLIKSLEKVHKWSKENKKYITGAKGVPREWMEADWDPAEYTDKKPLPTALQVQQGHGGTPSSGSAGHHHHHHHSSQNNNASGGSGAHNSSNNNMSGAASSSDATTATTSTGSQPQQGSNTSASGNQASTGTNNSAVSGSNVANVNSSSSLSSNLAAFSSRFPPFAGYAPRQQETQFLLTGPIYETERMPNVPSLSNQGIPARRTIKMKEWLQRRAGRQMDRDSIRKWVSSTAKKENLPQNEILKIYARKRRDLSARELDQLLEMPDSKELSINELLTQYRAEVPVAPRREDGSSEDSDDDSDEPPTGKFRTAAAAGGNTAQPSSSHHQQQSNTRPSTTGFGRT